MFDYNNLFYFQKNSVDKIELSLMNLVEVSSKSGVYLLLGFVYGNILNRILPAYIETKSKRDYVIEVFLTGALMGLLTFLSVKLLEYGVYNLVGKTQLSESSIYSVLMLITMFSVQSDLKKKLTHILTGQKQINDTFVAKVTDDDYDEEEYDINNALDQQNLIVQNGQPSGPVGPDGLNENTLPQTLNQNRANGGNMNMMNNNANNNMNSGGCANGNCNGGNNGGGCNCGSSNNGNNRGGCNCGMSSCNSCNSNTSIDRMTTKYNNNNNNNNFQMNPDGFSHFDRSDNENNNNRINGYCASSDQVCSGQWTDSKVSSEMNLNSFTGSSGGWGAPLI